MSTETNKALIRRSVEELNQGNVLETATNWDELFVPDYVSHDPAGGCRSREEYKGFLFRLLLAFPGHFTIEDVIAEADKVVLRYTFRGTHQGPLRDIPPTGKAVTFTGIYIYRIVAGKIVEGWQNADTLGLFQQLGVISAMG